MLVKSHKRFCKLGHDTEICGRTKHNTCKECAKTHQQTRYWKHRDIRNQGSVNARRLSRYGITGEQYNELINKQNGVCAICKTEGNKRSLSVDHDHRSGKIRGLLCHNCNLSLGLCHDSVETLQAAIEYLKTN